MSFPAGTAAPMTRLYKENRWNQKNIEEELVDNGWADLLIRSRKGWNKGGRNQPINQSRPLEQLLLS